MPKWLRNFNAKNVTVEDEKLIRKAMEVLCDGRCEKKCAKVARKMRNIILRKVSKGYTHRSSLEIAIMTVSRTEEERDKTLEHLGKDIGWYVKTIVEKEIIGYYVEDIPESPNHPTQLIQ